MNRKGEQTNLGLGLILTVAIGLIAALALMPAIFQNVGTTTNTATATNATYDVAGAGVTIDLLGQELIGTPFVVNESSGEALTVTTDYVIDEGVSTSTGVKTIRYTPAGAIYATTGVNITYEYGPDGYIDSSGGRSMAGLIAIFAALAVAVFALSPTLKSGVLNMLGR